MHDHHSATPHTGVDLQSLPAFMPDPALWLRVQAAQQARLQARRRWHTGLAAGGAIAAAVCAAVLLMPQMRSQPASQHTLAGQRESQALETEWLRMADSTSSTRPVTRLRAIDARLQAAYDRGAAVEELAPLWQQRNRALRGLITGAQGGGDAAFARDITRI